MDVSDANRLKALEDEKAKLKKLLADQMLEASAPKAEAASLVAQFGGERLPDGRRRVVRLGTGPKRTIKTTLIGGSAVCSAALVLIADSFGRLIIAPVQIPVGIAMAILGVPFLLSLLWRRRYEL